MLNRKSCGGTIAKKRIDSQNSDRKMPIVVRIAISEATSRISISPRSTRVRARKAGLIRLNAKAPPAKASRMAIAAPVQP